jgi:uncharacterized paraquat-inducible protein A
MVGTKVNLIQMLERIKNPKRTGYPDYRKYSYCIKCELARPLEAIFCPDCGTRVRHRPAYKNSKYWKGKLKYY